MSLWLQKINKKDLTVFVAEKKKLSLPVFLLYPHVATAHTSDTKSVWDPPPPKQYCSAVLPGILQFNSIMAVSTWGYCHIPQIKGSVS